jgi:ribosomal protein S27AE
MNRTTFEAAAAANSRLSRDLNRTLLFGAAAFLVIILFLARWMEREWGHAANWPYALVTLLLTGAGLTAYAVVSRGRTRKLGITCGRCGFAMLRAADIQAGKCGRCGSVPWTE